MKKERWRGIRTSARNRPNYARSAILLANGAM
jgi:hypothetical protein